MMAIGYLKPILRIAPVVMAVATFPIKAEAAPAADAIEDHNVIIVTGEKQRKKKISNFIKSAVNVKNGQYARFNSSICAVAMGFNEQYNRVIEDRMRAVTKAADVRTGEPGCKPNMAIVAAKGSQDFIGTMRKKHPNAFGNLSIPARDRIMNGKGPAYVWNTTYAIGSAGSRNSSPGGGTGSSSSSLDGFGSGGGAPSFSGSNSRINTSIVRDINMAIVVIEKEALLGINLRQIADYGVMRLLANTDEPSEANLSERSILTLFSDRAEGYEAPQSVTAWDLALLKALYSTKNNVSASMQRAAMTGVFEEKLLEIAEGAERAEERQN